MGSINWFRAFEALGRDPGLFRWNTPALIKRFALGGDFNAMESTDAIKDFRDRIRFPTSMLVDELATDVGPEGSICLLQKKGIGTGISLGGFGPITLNGAS